MMAPFPSQISTPPRKTARNRFGLKVTVDDRIVTGWEQND